MMRYYEIERMRMIVRRSGVVPLIQEVLRPSTELRKSAGRTSPPHRGELAGLFNAHRNLR
jgi:hypothetical protein